MTVLAISHYLSRVNEAFPYPNSQKKSNYCFVSNNQNRVALGTFQYTIIQGHIIPVPNNKGQIQGIFLTIS